MVPSCSTIPKNVLPVHLSVVLRTWARIEQPSATSCSQVVMSLVQAGPSFGGSLKVGDTSGSGLAEFPDACLPGLPDCGGEVGLVNVDNALVVLALHSHGPRLEGQALKSQISSFLGGCENFIGTGPGGFAASYSEIPTNVGECSTFQISPHPPN